MEQFHNLFFKSPMDVTHSITTHMTMLFRLVSVYIILYGVTSASGPHEFFTALREGGQIDLVIMIDR